MARQYGEAWLTSVTSDDSVIPALVLAESLKRTKTTKRIGVITSENVSKENRMVLRKAFDAFFLMDDSFSIDGVGKEDEAKIYAFSLRFFEKCVFVSSKSLVLENADRLFEGNQVFKGLKNEKDGSIDLSLFMFSPSLDLCEYLATNMNQNGKTFSGKYMKAWMDKKHGQREWGFLPGNSVLKLSVHSGSFYRQSTNVEMIQFVDVDKPGSFVDLISSLKQKDTGLLEKLVVEKWLEIFHEHVAGPLYNPKSDIASSFKLGDEDICYNEPIAIIGMSCRYPGANNVEEFWNLLYQGEEGIREPPAFRWTKEHSIRVSQQDRKTNAGFLSTTVDEFDARFFGVSPKEAAFMDPQARLLHEVMWESLEDSGIDPLSLYGTHTGIFTGSWMNDYKDIVQSSAERDFFRTYMGNSIGAAAARLSFLLGLTGPSIATESGCSSAIVALDLAVKSLRNGESTLALAGGVNLLLHPFTGDIMNYVISPNGRCKTFDAKADGFGRAEGCGVLVLKRLTDALRDRDNIWAVIRGSAVSQEGISRSLGTPTVHCESLAMKLALEDANVAPKQVSFVETHGTGTAVGDPMEIAAIAQAYHSEDRTNPLIVGSVKTNVGHTESCSGITGIMKTILAMQHELIPKHRNLETLNPDIHLDMIPAKIPLEPIPWPKVKGQPRIAGVSSFGITGTDGHVIIQEAPDYELPKFTLGLERPLHIMKLSCKTGEALDDLLLKYQEMFQEKMDINEDNFANAAYTANVGRAAFSHRAFIVAGNYGEALKVAKSETLERGETLEAGKICFLFTGQGCQYNGMAKQLYETSPVFRVHFDECDQTLRKMYGLSVREVLWESDSSSKELSRTIYSQTSIFCVEYCLLKLWESWGIMPDYVLGHSLGEFCAAVAAGVLTFENALKLVAERSRLIDNLPRGSMLVIKASKQEVENCLNATKLDLDFAATNTKEQTVVAGDTEKVEKFLNYLKTKDYKAIILEATHAFHSRHMNPMLEEYRQIAETINFKSTSTKCKYVSGMDGRILENPLAEINADYWVRHTREKVSFIDACQALREESCQNFLEIGPQPILSSFVMMNHDVSLNCLPSLRRGANEWQTILASLGKLYLLGCKIDWKGFDAPYKRSKVSLPFHPFHRKSFWVENSGTNTALIHPLVGYPMPNASNLHIFQNDINLKSIPYLKDHCIGNRIVFPGAGYTEMCLTACYCVAGSLTDTLEKPKRAIRLENVRIDAPLELKEEKNCRVQVVVDLNSTDEQTDAQHFCAKVFHQNNTQEGPGKWILHASANFSPAPAVKDALIKWNPDRISEIMNTVEPTDFDEIYKRLDGIGLKFGDTFKRGEKSWNVRIGNTNADEIVASVQIPEDCNKYLMHPLLIDAMFQGAILTKMCYETERLQVPVKIPSITVFTSLGATDTNDNKDSENAENMNTKNLAYIHSWWEGEKTYIFLVAHDLSPIALIEDLELVDTTARMIESILEQQTSTIADAWDESWRPISGPSTDLIELPDVCTTLNGDAFQTKISQIGLTTAEDDDVAAKVDRLIYLCSLNGLYDLGWRPQPGEVTSVSQFCEMYRILPGFSQLVHFYFTMFNDNGIMEFNNATKLWKVNHPPSPPDEIKSEMQSLTALLKTTKALTIVIIYEHIAERLTGILTGEINPLSILFPTDPNMQHISADVFYQNHPARPAALEKLKELWSVVFGMTRSQNPGGDGIYRVLEVGAGTGSLTLVCMQQLSKYWGDKFEYYYTDISKSFFYPKKMQPYEKNIKYALFNIEENPMDQGIPLNYFDMVFCTDVIHATMSLQESLTHLRQTLRPKGLLCFTETILTASDLTFVFGLLSGYWRMEDKDLRPYHCCVGEPIWRQVLDMTGFQSVGVTEFYRSTFACITAEATEESKFVNMASRKDLEGTTQKEWVLFTDRNNDALVNVAEILASFGNKVTMVYPSYSNDATPVPMRECCESSNIVTTTVQNYMEEPSKIKNLLKSGNVQGVIYGWGMDLTEKDQEKLAAPLLFIAQEMLVQRKPPKLYVLSQGVHPIAETSSINPSAATLFGMVKCLKNENWEVFARYVDLEHGASADVMTNQILFELAMSREFNRIQVAYREQLRYEPRFAKVSISVPKEQLAMPQCTSRYHLRLPETRMIQDLEFQPLEEELLGERDVEIRTKAFSLNFKDILTILKPSAEFEKLNTVGLDFAGVVTKAGPEAKWKVGDRVFGVNFKNGQLPSHLVIDSNAVLSIPDGMTYWEICTVPAVYATAIHCLLDIAKMTAGENVLIHTGSGGVGLAAIQLAKFVGANIITTAGNARKRAYLKSLGIEHVFHSRNPSFGDDIMRVTNGRGVDIVLNSITGPGLKEASLRVCASNARFVEMSKLSIWTEEEVKAQRPDVMYSIVDLTVLERDDWDNLLEKMRELLVQGKLKTIPYVKFDALYIRQAFQYFQKAKHIGKVVCVMPDVISNNGKFNVHVPLFNTDSTYLITGGLGGIGFEVCKWMLQKGASDVVLMGRSPPKEDIARQIKELNGKGYNVVVQLGDVGKMEDCKAIFDYIQLNMKPLRGIQHCAGVLQDNMYHQQTWKSFEATFAPKVTGTWNLHNLTLDMQLEHFVFYSSLTALMGTPSQANHAAANCFEDSFTHYRHSLGLPATTINWGQWGQVGCAKEINLPGVLPGSVSRMLNGLEYSLRTQKIQSCYGDFESFTTWSMICPMTKSYLDERLLIKDQPRTNQGLKAEQLWKEMDAAEDKEEKIKVISVYLKHILRTGLRLEADEPINDNANIQDLGVDSLMLIELKNSIQSLLGSRLTVTASLLKGRNTVRELATALVNKLIADESGIDDTAITSEEWTELLKTDCQLDENIQPPENALVTKSSAIKSLLVTGCTGQLGPYMLAELCKSYKSVEKIICIVRTANGVDPAEKLQKIVNSMELSQAVDFSRIHCVRGDVAKLNFGMEDDEYLKLCQNVDAVIHTAVKGDHIEPYRKCNDENGTDIRTVNVGGTVNIIRFAATEKVKHVYFASAYSSIFGGNDSNTLCDDWPELDDIAKIVEHKVPGYQTSKYVCEMLLKQANVRGIPCKIFRFPWITGDSKTGRLNYASNHFILRLLSYLKFKSVPSLVMPAIVLPVDICAGLSLQLFFDDKTPFEIFNIGPPNPEIEQEFVKLAKDEFNMDLELVELQEFSEKLETDSPLEELKDLYTDVGRLMKIYTSGAFPALNAFINFPDTLFKNTKLRKYIPDYDKNIESSMNIIRKNLRYVKSTGFFEKFNI